MSHYFQNPTAMADWDFGGGTAHDVAIKKAQYQTLLAILGRYRAGGRPREHVHVEPTDEPLDEERRPTYDSEERRKIREKFYGPGEAAANKIQIEDPEHPGVRVWGKILGRNHTRRSWLGVALPSNNPKFPKIGRAYWIDGSRYHSEFMRYVEKGANITLSAAANKSQLEDCTPEDFELNCVLVMPWGKAFHYHAFGLPHYVSDRPFCLWSKGLLGSARDWTVGKATDMMHDHMSMAGQSIPGTGAARKRIAAKAWHH